MNEKDFRDEIKEIKEDLIKDSEKVDKFYAKSFIIESIFFFIILIFLIIFILNL